MVPGSTADELTKARKKAKKSAVRLKECMMSSLGVKEWDRSESRNRSWTQETSRDVECKVGDGRQRRCVVLKEYHVLKYLQTIYRK